MQTGFWRWRRAILLGRTAVPVSAGVWESETAATTWTVTGCGCVMIEGNEKNEGKDGAERKKMRQNH